MRLKLHFGLPTDDSTPHSCFNPINFLIKKFNKVVRKSIKTQIIKVPLHPPVFWYSFGRAALEVGGRRGAPQYILHVENCFNATLKQRLDLGWTLKISCVKNTLPSIAISSVDRTLDSEIWWPSS